MATSSMDEEAFSLALQLSISSALPMALRSAIELNLLELIKKLAPEPVSASQLAAQLPTKDHDRASLMIDRILRFLSAHSVLVCILKPIPGGGVERFYSLSPHVDKFLTPNEDGVSLAPLCLMVQGKVMMESWYYMKDAVLMGGYPFNRAHDGLNLFEYQSVNPIFNDVFNETMQSFSNIVMKKVLEEYKGFEGVESIVDVGGGVGVSLKLILSKYPTIKAINFDLPHVVEHAPPHPGVEHIRGDMFVRIPKAEAILLKSICCDWSDAHCHRLLKNCYESLPDKGKVIIVEHILPENPNIGFGSNFDVLMLAYTPGGQERTVKEFEEIAKQAGFRDLYKVCCVYGTAVIELHK